MIEDNDSPPLLCARCYGEGPLSAAQCDEKPEEMSGAIGMYHCPDCGAMVLAGLPHPPLCAKCQPLMWVALP